MGSGKSESMTVVEELVTTDSTTALDEDAGELVDSMSLVGCLGAETPSSHSSAIGLRGVSTQLRWPRENPPLDQNIPWSLPRVGHIQLRPVG